jgi:hypothetical protein
VLTQQFLSWLDHLQGFDLVALAFNPGDNFTDVTGLDPIRLY